jgi:hypothetical protein
VSLVQLLSGRPDGMFIAPFEQGEIGGPLPCGLTVRVRGHRIEAL